MDSKQTEQDNLKAKTVQAKIDHEGRSEALLSKIREVNQDKCKTSKNNTLFG